MNLILRDYQIDISKRAVKILQDKNIVYLAMQVRTGKTITSLETCKLFGAKKVLFITKIKAFESIKNDCKDFNFKTFIINNESLHKIIDNDFDVIISDEHHRSGAYPKTNNWIKIFKEKFSNKPMIFLSGTPTPESFSQWYHQFWVSDFSPFKKYKNFYKWSNNFVNVTQKNLGYAKVNDYSHAKIDLIQPIINDYIITFTQKESGFKSIVNEKILYVEMQPITYEIIKKLKKDLIVKNNLNQVILADTAVKLMQKIHQLFSGTCKFEDGTSKVIDNSKALFIFNYFKNKKIAIFYKFKEEYNALVEVYGQLLTNDLQEFNATNKCIALQIVTGREGISLSNAESLVYYNIDFSAVSYWQSRDRLTTINRLENNIYWIFSKDGIEDKIYKTVLLKKNFTTSIFKQWNQKYNLKL